MNPTRLPIFFLLLGLLTPACEFSSALDKIDCAPTLDAQDSSELTALLAEAKAGSCILVHPGSYPGTFAVPAGVALAGSAQRPPVFTGSEIPDQPALILYGGPGSLLADLTIEAAAGHGLVVVGGPARVQALDLSAPRGLALLLRCAKAPCDDAAFEVVASTVHDSLNGVLISGVRAHLEDNTLRDFDGVTLGSGIGLTLAGGARVESVRLRVQGSGEVAVLVDGASTTSRFTDIEVRENLGRGLWAQHLRGTASAPALEIDGGGSEIVSNTLVGLGSMDSAGIVVGTCIVMRTAALEISTDQDPRTSVGDGIGLFGGSSEITLGDGVILRDNARAGLLIDQGGAGIVVGTAIVEPGASGFGVVVQRTTERVDLADGIVASDPGEILGVPREPIPVPGI